MTIRTSQSTIRFDRPFKLAGIDALQPAGLYTLETDEELLQDVSFLAYRRIETRLFLPAVPGTTILGQVISIDPMELKAAQEGDGVTASGTGAAQQGAARIDVR